MKSIQLCARRCRYALSDISPRTRNVKRENEQVGVLPLASTAFELGIIYAHSKYETRPRDDVSPEVIAPHLIIANCERDDLQRYFPDIVGEQVKRYGDGPPTADPAARGEQDGASASPEQRRKLISILLAWLASLEEQRHVRPASEIIEKDFPAFTRETKNTGRQHLLDDPRTQCFQLTNWMVAYLSEQQPQER